MVAKKKKKRINKKDSRGTEKGPLLLAARKAFFLNHSFFDHDLKLRQKGRGGEGGNCHAVFSRPG